MKALLIGVVIFIIGGIAIGGKAFEALAAQVETAPVMGGGEGGRSGLAGGSPFRRDTRY